MMKQEKFDKLSREEKIALWENTFNKVSRKRWKRMFNLLTKCEIPSGRWIKSKKYGWFYLGKDDAVFIKEYYRDYMRDWIKRFIVKLLEDNVS